MNSWKIISVTPAGRRRYLQVLVPYLLKNREHVNEHHFWLNTRDPDDIAYIQGLASTYPDYFKIKSRPVFDRKSPGHCIWQYWQDCVDEDAIYIRLDDDVCFMENTSIVNLIKFRIRNPDPFLVYGNVVNNALCSYVQQTRGIIPSSWGTVQFECMDEVGWLKTRFAERLHNLFIHDILSNSIERWKFDPILLSEYQRFSINVVCWFGKDLRKIDELTVQDLRSLNLRHPETGEDLSHEEAFISQFIPAKFNRPCIITGDALFAHFAFYTQRVYLERYTALLDSYCALSAGKMDSAKEKMIRIKGAAKKCKFLGAPWFWFSLGRKIRDKLFL